MKNRFCKDCKYYTHNTSLDNVEPKVGVSVRSFKPTDFDYHLMEECHVHETQHWNLVTGEEYFRGSKSCYIERKEGKCGKKGKLWRRKDEL